ncbi:hypothetical protein TrST_g9070 [Triparma strigata]|uniref:Uncharacterized protein n=1 Tax=Triparma strigata TaxID=1606541 RepID=A0A9W7A3W8_9STRA|nr:hypothetical protein TrST_g9070 [Triparma strigata]
MLHSCGSSTSSCLPTNAQSTVLSTFHKIAPQYTDQYTNTNTDTNTGDGSITDDKMSSSSPPLSSTLDLHSISTGTNHAVAVTKTGQVYCWGTGVPIEFENDGSKLPSIPGSNDSNNNNNNIASSSVPSHPFLLSPPPPTLPPLPSLLTFSPPLRPKIISATCGSSHTLLFTSSGLLYTFGSNTHAQLGHPHLSSLKTPQPVTSLSDKIIVSGSAGKHHTLVLTLSGIVYAFGGNKHGQLGNGLYLKRTINLPSHSFQDGRNWINKVDFYKTTDRGIKIYEDCRITSLACSFEGYGSYGIGVNGECYYWGRVDADSEENDDVERVPREVIFGRKVWCKMVKGGRRWGVIVGRDGTVWSLGAAGPWLGVGPNCRWRQRQPCQIMLSADVLINGAECGEAHTVLTTTCGKVLACGEANFGRLGVREGVEKASDRFGGIPRECEFGEREGEGIYCVMDDGFNDARQAVVMQGRREEEGWEKVGGGGGDDDGGEVEEEKPSAEMSSGGRTKMKRINIMVAAGTNHTLVYEKLVEFEG